MTPTKHVPLMTFALLAAIATMWVLVRVRCGDLGGPWNESSCTGELAVLGGLVPPRLWLAGEWWRLATAAFVHGSWAHVLTNGWSLWVLGPWVERALGRWGLLGLFTTSSIGGGLASTAWAEGGLIVGASGGLFGLGAALLLLERHGHARVRSTLEDVSLRGLAIALALMLFIGMFVPVIAQAGHVGGALFGACAACVALDVRGSRWWGTGLLALAMTLGVWLAHHPLRPAHAAEITGFYHLDREEQRESLRAFEQALEARPDDPVLANAVAYALAEAGVELERATKLVEAALAAEPNNADYLDTLGWIACKQGKVDEGLALLERAAAAAPTPIAEIAEHRASCATAAKGAPES